MKYLVNQKEKKIFNGSIPRYDDKLDILLAKEVELPFLYRGKKVYMQDLAIDYLPNNSRREVICSSMPTNIMPIGIKGFARKGEGISNDIVDIFQLTSQILYRASEKKLYIDTNTDRSMYRGWIQIIYQYES